MKRLAVIPMDAISLYLASGYNEKWLREYFNPKQYFDEVYVLSPLEEDNPNLLGMKAVHTKPQDLAKRLKQFKIDVVRAYGGSRPCEMACRQKVDGVPVVVSVHDTDPHNLREDWIGKADVVWCMSDAVKQLVSENFKDQKRLWVLPNRVHFDYMRPYRPEETQDLEKKYPFKHKIIHVGRKVRQKNLDNLIKALKILGNDYCLLVVGKGDDAPYKDIARQEGVLHRCFFIEAIANEELARYFSWADCMCTPSRWEGFGMVFMEALACEGVVVTSDLAPMNEFIQDRVNGILVKDYENPQAIAQAVELACHDKGLRKVLQQNARKSVEKFEQSKVDLLEVEYYEKVLKMRDNNEFRLSAKDKFLMSPLGSRVSSMIPVSVKKAFLKGVSR